MTQISFIGGGNMAQALLGGLLNAGHDPAQLAAADPFDQAREAIARKGVRASASNAEVAHTADVIVLAVKPQVLTNVLSDMAASIPPNALLLSIVAGMPIKVITAACRASADAKRAIVRCMPNTPALLGKGVTGMYANAAVSQEQKQLAEQIATATGDWVWVNGEADLDAVTAVSGSGPAYFFYLMEAMVAAGIEQGLEPELAAKLTIATATGAAAMAAQPGADPGVLRQNVTSPGGTTERALRLFDDAQMSATIRSALKGAAERSAELAREFGR